MQLVNEQELFGEVNFSHLQTEELIAHFCKIELKRRKELGEYKGKFSAMTHFFGY